jgi:hypothetical protein
MENNIPQSSCEKDLVELFPTDFEYFYPLKLKSRSILKRVKVRTHRHFRHFYFGQGILNLPGID